MMISVITGDIIRSRTIGEPEIWLSALKDALKTIQPDASKWEVYRGDSFQMETRSVAESFLNALYIKACIKCIKGLDVRLAIGIGDKSFEGKKITESNGDAFMFSGETLETLKRDKINLQIRTSYETLNRELNLYFKFAMIVMDSWSANSAEIVKLVLENPDALQETLGKKIGINQNAISGRRKRAHLDELMELDSLFRHKINQLK